VCKATPRTEHALGAFVLSQSGPPAENVLADRSVQVLLARRRPLHLSGARALDHAIRALGAPALDYLQQAADNRDPFSALMLRSCVVRGLADQGDIDQGLAMLRDLLEGVWRLKETHVITQALRRLVPNASHFGRSDAGTAIIEGVLAQLDRASQNNTLGLRERGEILATCAATIGRLGEHEAALQLLTRVIESFEEMVTPHEQGVSYLFETLSRIVDEVIALGGLQEGVALIERAVQAISNRLTRTSSAENPYFVHHARIKCAVAMLSLDQHERGVKLLGECVQGILQTRELDGRDRIDLLIEAMQALSLIGLADDTRVQLMERLVDAGMSNESRSSGSEDNQRRDLLRATLREMVQRHTAYRLAIKKVRALEERLLRARVISNRDLPTPISGAS